MPNPTDIAVRDYLRAVTGSEDGQIEQRPDWKIPHTSVGAGIETTPIQSQHLDTIERSIMDDNILGSFEELSVLREAYLERQRLRQVADNSPVVQLQAIEYRINNIRLHRRLVLENKETLLKAQKLKTDMSALGLEQKISPDIAANAFSHLGELTGVVNERLAIGQLALLLNQKKDGKDVPHQLILDAIANVPTLVKAKKMGETAEAIINKSSLETMSAVAALEALTEPIRIAEENMGWTLSYDATVAGVSPEHIGINPVDVYYNELLAEAVGSATQHEFDLARRPGNETQTARIRAFRDQLTLAFKDDLTRIHSHAIGNLRGVSVDFADTTYAPGTEQPPYVFPPALLGELPELRTESDEQVTTVIGAFRKRALMVIGGQDEEGRTVKGLMDMSIFDFKDSWIPTVDRGAVQLRQEDFYKKHVRFGLVYPLLDALTRAMAAPDVISRGVTRAGLNAATGTDFGIQPLTFKEEAEKAMSKVRKAWKLPETIEFNGEEVPFDFYNPDHWDTLSPEQWSEIQKSQRSTMDALTVNREAMTNSLSAVEGDLRSFEALYAFSKPDQMIGVIPDEQTFADLQSNTTSVAELMADPELKTNPAKLAACYYYVIVQLEGHSAQYAENFTTLAAELNEIGDYDIDAAAGLEEAGRNIRVPYWFFAIVGGLMAWYGTGYFRAKAPLRFARAGRVMARDVYRTARFGYRQTIGRVVPGRAPVNEAERLAANQADELATSVRRVTELETEITRLRGTGQEAAQQIIEKEAELARLNARVFTLEEQLAKASTVPGAVARRTETLARVTQFVRGSGAEVMQRIATNQRTISATETTIKEILSLLDETARTARAVELATLQKTLGELLRADRTLRIDAAKSLLGEGVNVTDEAAELIWRAHITDSLSGKVRLLRQAMGMVYENADDAAKAANLLARSGVAGDIATVIANTEKLTSRVSAQTLARLTEMGLPEASETMLKLTSNPRGLRFLEEAFAAGGKQGATRAAQYLAALGEGAQEALTDPSLVKAVIASGDDTARLGMTMTKLVQGGTYTGAECLSLVDEIGNLRRLGPRALSGLESTMLVAGPLLEAAMLGYDIYELIQTRERRQEEIKNMIGSLDQMVSQGLMTKEGDTYKGPGCSIDVRQINSMTGSAEEAQWARTAVDATALVGTTATSIVVLSGAAGPPGLAAGLIVAGVMITVHVGISTVEGSIDQYRRSEFLKGAPPWLIALMGPEGLVGKTTEDVIREHTGTMRSEYMPRSWGEAGLMLNPITGPVYSGSRGVGNVMNAEQIEEEKQEVKDKSMQALAYRSFAASHPEFVSELPSRGNIQELLVEGSDFLKPGGDYERIVKPLITLQLQAASRPGFVGVSGAFGYESSPDVGAIQRLVLPERSQLDGSIIGVGNENQLLEKAGSRAMTFYVHHLREQRYRNAIAAIESDARYDGEYKVFLIEQYDNSIDENKSHDYVFNVHPKTLSRSGLTIAEKLVTEHALTTEKLSLFGGDTFSAAEAAAMGYSFPSGRQNMSLKRFLDVYVEPEHTKETENRLESYSAANPDLPFDFRAMENMKTMEDFEATVGRAIDRAANVNIALSQPGSLRNDADLHKLFDAISTEDLKLFETFDKHKDFYNMYLARWRKSERYVTSYAKPWVTMLVGWKENGYPTLIDEQRFTAAQQSLVRPVNNPLNVRSELSWLRQAEQALPGFTYDPEHPNRMISTYSAFMAEMQTMTTTQFENPFGKMLAEENPLEGLLRPQRDAAEQFSQRNSALTRLRGLQDRMEEERNLRVRDGSTEGVPLQDFSNLTTSIAVEDKNLSTFMRSWAKNDGFDALRADMLSNRIFVVLDPTQALPMLRLNRP